MTGPAALGACGGAGAHGADTASASDTDKARRLLERARAQKDAELYARLMSRFEETPASRVGRTEYADILISQGQAALSARDFGKSFTHAQQARIFGNTAQTRVARQILKQSEDGIAQTVAKAAADLSTRGQCDRAVSMVATRVSGNIRPSLRAAVQAGAADALVACLTAQMQANLVGGSVDEARMVLESKNATRALSQDAYKRAYRGLEQLIVQSHVASLTALVDAREFAPAVLKIQALANDGTLTEPEEQMALGMLHERIAKVLVADAKASIESRTAAETLAALEHTLATVGWDKPPEDVVHVQEALVAASLCEQLRCRFTKPTRMFVFGVPQLANTRDLERPATTPLTHGQAVWKLATAGRWTLIATGSEAPDATTREAALTAGAGFIAAQRIRRSETRLRLPPPEELKGFRVWGPLNPPSQEYSLGIVHEVQGREASVRRISDDGDVLVKVSSLRIGALEPEQRVTTFCGGSHTPVSAKIGKVLTRGTAPRVRVSCPDKGTGEGVESAGALRAKRAWLPRR